MTPQQKWDSLPEADKNAVTAFIEQVYAAAVADQRMPVALAGPIKGRPRMYPIHPDDHPCA